MLKKTFDWVIILIFPVLLLAGILYFNIVTFHQYKETQVLKDQGINTTAIVIEKDISHHTKGSSVNYLTYEYKAKDLNDKTILITSKQEVDINTYAVYQVNNEIEIYYLKDKIEISNIQGNKNIRNLTICILLDICLFVFLIVLYKKSLSQKTSKNI